MQGFNVHFPGGYVSVHSDTDHVRAIIDAELHPFITTNESEGNKTKIGEVRYSSSEDEYRRLMSMYVPDQAKLLLLHNPRNNHWERRSGTVTELSDGSILVEALSEGATVHASQENKEVYIVHKDPALGANFVRRVIRDQLIFPYLESLGGVALHSALLAGPDGEGLLIVGPSGSGKTAFYLAAMARRDDWIGICSERTIILPDDSGGIAGYPSPERVSFLPGALSAYGEMSEYILGISPDDYWLRRKRIHVPWTAVVEAFGKTLSAVTTPICALGLPEYGGGALLSRAGPNVARARVYPEVFTGRDRTKPNWLGWYGADSKGTDRTLRLLLGLPTFHIDWNEEADTNGILDTLISHTIKGKQKISGSEFRKYRC
jgi:hypothetical protein